MRLWPTKRFVTEARMSLPWNVRFVGLQLLLNHRFCHGSRYARVGSCGCWWRPPAVSGLTHASPVVALLPVVVSVVTPVCGSASHGTREAMLLAAYWQFESAGLLPGSEGSQQ